MAALTLDYFQFLPDEIDRIRASNARLGKAFLVSRVEDAKGHPHA